MIKQLVKGDIAVKTSPQPIPSQQKDDTIREERSKEERLTKEQARHLTSSMNRFLQTVDTQLRFKFHDELNEYYVTIVNTSTDEVVREIPPKKLMDIYAAMREFIGVLVDHKI